jgi:hypothetical protein
VCLVSSRLKGKPGFTNATSAEQRQQAAVRVGK